MPHQELNGADIGSACPALFLCVPGLVSPCPGAYFLRARLIVLRWLPQTAFLETDAA